MQKPSLPASLLLLALLPTVSFATDASVHVRGAMTCDGKPYANQKIQLYEKNWVGRDLLVVETLTDDFGQFVLKASIYEWPMFYPHPYVYFGNYCDINNQIGNFQCADAIKIFVPNYFVHEGHLPNSVFDIGSVEMRGLSSEKKGLEELVYTIFTQQDCRDVKRIR